MATTKKKTTATTNYRYWVSMHGTNQPFHHKSDAMKRAYDYCMKNGLGADVNVYYGPLPISPYRRFFIRGISDTRFHVVGQKPAMVIQTEWPIPGIVQHVGNPEIVYKVTASGRLIKQFERKV